jgi:hypothetical protein
MKFYLNQKSLPIVRRCQNCRFYRQEGQTCMLLKVASAYDHQKRIMLKTSDNLYCDKHEHYNEEELARSAVEIELGSVQEAMDLILMRKHQDNAKKGMPQDDYNA